MRFLKLLGEWIYIVVVSSAMALLISAFLFQPSAVLGQSMEPTLHNKQIFLLSKISHVLGRVPMYNDIVIIDSRVLKERSWKDDFTDPIRNITAAITGREPNHYLWVKRVVGKPGDVIEFKNNKMYKNGLELKEAYIKEEMRPMSNWKAEVPSGHVFVMGDNRNNSSDSRIIGSVPLDHVLGIMLF